MLSVGWRVRALQRQTGGALSEIRSNDEQQRDANHSRPKQHVPTGQARPSHAHVAERSAREVEVAEKLLALFPVFSDTREHFEETYAQMAAFFKESVLEDYEAILEKRNIPETLDVYDLILATRAKKIDTISPTAHESDLHVVMDPAQLVHCRVMALKKKREEELTRELEQVGSCYLFSSFLWR
ncbi:hypothetical protein BC830DRAFT_1122677 [Chytriomyces sp. MP71]|nr:hypothetical protein BC830DRAFT_1122677 [Chytriomyces sp. MP71]